MTHFSISPDIADPGATLHAVLSAGSFAGRHGIRSDLCRFLLAMGGHREVDGGVVEASDLARKFGLSISDAELGQLIHTLVKEGVLEELEDESTDGEEYVTYGLSARGLRVVMELQRELAWTISRED